MKQVTSDTFRVLHRLPWVLFTLDGSRGEFCLHECKDKEESRCKDKNMIFYNYSQSYLFEFLTEH
jgi:hypothetical protein